jgi:phosphohistidine phosphatase
MKLLLLRHAKSSWGNPDLDDHDRPLNRRGERGARRMGAHLAEHRARPTLVLCSSALRTVQTLERVVAELAEEPERSIEPGLYLASAATLLERIRDVGPEHAEILVIGHNPGIAELADGLAGQGDLANRERMQRKYPTGGLAELVFPGSDWREARPGAGRLESFRTPRELG